MRYPATMGKWQRQAPQPHQQWIYKSTAKTWAQPAIDHITVELAANTPTATMTGLHYTTRGTTTRSIQIGWRQVLIPVQTPWGARGLQPAQVPNIVQCDGLVFYYDYSPNLAAGTLNRSVQVNHNDYRFPKQYTGDNTAALPLHGAPQVRTDGTLAADYAQVFNMREVDKEVADFWASFPKIKVSLSSVLPDSSLIKQVEVRQDLISDTVNTDGNGIAKVYGYELGLADVRCPPILTNWTRIQARTGYVSSSYWQYTLSFSAF